MRPEEKRDLALFDGAARKRVAADVGCTTGQVDDCIARFLWTRQMTRSGRGWGLRPGNLAPRSCLHARGVSWRWEAARRAAALAALPAPNRRLAAPK